jgi:hypothetical protein
VWRLMRTTPAGVSAEPSERVKLYEYDETPT